MTDSNYLNDMIGNLGVKVDPETRIKLNALPFTTYPHNLQTADRDIRDTLKSQQDNNLKIELLKLQVHYLHNLDAVKSAETLKEQNKHLNLQLSDIQQRLNGVQTEKQRLETEKQRLETEKQRLEDDHTENSHTKAQIAYKEKQLADKEKQLAEQKTQLEVEHNENINKLRHAEAQLADKKQELADVHKQNNVIHTKIQALANTEGVDPHLSNQPHHNAPKKLSVVQFEKVEVVNLTPDESKYIAELKTKLTNPINVVLPIDEFGGMFTIMRKYKTDIQKLLSNKIYSYIHYFSTNNLSGLNTDYINILIDESSSVNINIGIDNTTSNIDYNNKVNNPLSINITPITTKGVKEKASNVASNQMFRDCYRHINKLLTILFPKATAPSKNKYLKYKNKYLQLKKLYNL